MLEKYYRQALAFLVVLFVIWLAFNSYSSMVDELAQTNKDLTTAKNNEAVLLDANEQLGLELNKVQEQHSAVKAVVEQLSTESGEAKAATVIERIKIVRYKGRLDGLSIKNTSRLERLVNRGTQKVLKDIYNASNN